MRLRRCSSCRASFLAGLGLVGVFSAATNTPIACFVLGLELFGADAAVYMFAVSVIAYLCSGHKGIYSSQMIGVFKNGRGGTPVTVVAPIAKKEPSAPLSEDSRGWLFCFCVSLQ